MKKLFKFLFPSWDIKNKFYWLCTVPALATIGFIVGVIIGLLILTSCQKEDNTKETKEVNNICRFKAPISEDSLPNDLIWLTNDKDPIFASSWVKKGGTFRISINSFPNTFRVVGPDSNNSFRNYILNNQLSLVILHPNTENIISCLATHWAYDKDDRTMYFKLNKNARWSDDKPVTAHDFAYTLEFMRSKYIVAPWYNDYYTEFIDKVTVYDDHTLAVSTTRPMPDLHLYTNISPTPSHFYGKLDNTFVQKYNWEIVPNTGAYQIEKFEKGKSITFTRKKDWWAKDLKYFKNRFNVDRVKFIVIKDMNMSWEYFKKGMLDTFGLTYPFYWHDKSNIDIFKNGYVNKIWFYNDTRQSAWGIYLNQDREIFKNENVRYAFAHAMNFDKLNTQLLRNEYYRLQHGFVGYGEYSNEEIKAREFDLDAVTFYMTKAEWQRGSDGIWKKNNMRFSIVLTYTDNPLNTERLTVLKEEAKKAGIEIKLDALDGASMYKKVIEKKHDATWWSWSTSYRPQYWEHYHSINAHKPQTNNITNTDNPSLDFLIEEYRNATDSIVRSALSRAIQIKIYEQGAFVPAFMVPYVRHAYWRWWLLPKFYGTKISSDLFDPFDSTIGGLFWFDKEIYENIKKAIKNKEKYDQVVIIDKTYIMEDIE